MPPRSRREVSFHRYASSSLMEKTRKYPSKPHGKDQKGGYPLYTTCRREEYPLYTTCRREGYHLLKTP